MRKVIYVSGTRADFGLMQSTLKLLADDDDMDLSVVATGMHLSKRYGHTLDDIKAAGLEIAASVPTQLEPTTGATMARAIGTMITAFTGVFEQRQPDIVLLLGDRGEMLAAAIAAIHLNIPVAHIHGGERSGTVDEPVRHAISKLSHIHFTATQNSADRLVAMGERKEHVFVSGAPGLDGLEQLDAASPQDLQLRFGLSRDRRVALFLFHPVLQEAEQGEKQAREILQALFDDGWQVVALMPNADAGSAGIRRVLESVEHDDFHTAVHLERADFIGMMKYADVMIGNSSAGIIEAASFGTPVINIGSRQALRERNGNVTDLDAEGTRLRRTLADIRDKGRFEGGNIYGDGSAGQCICKVLKTVDLNPALVNKVMAY